MSVSNLDPGRQHHPPLSTLFFSPALRGIGHLWCIGCSRLLQNKLTPCRSSFPQALGLLFFFCFYGYVTTSSVNRHVEGSTLMHVQSVLAILLSETFQGYLLCFLCPNNLLYFFPAFHHCGNFWEVVKTETDPPHLTKDPHWPFGVRPWESCSHFGQVLGVSLTTSIQAYAKEYNKGAGFQIFFSVLGIFMCIP